MEIEQLWLDKQTRVDELLTELLQVQRERDDRELKIKFYTYPSTGVKATLAIGTTSLNFESGTITSPTDVVTHMKHNLQSDGKDFLRSFYVNTDKSVVVQLDGSDKIYIEEEKDAVGTYQQFKELKITTTESTTVFLLCCTNPEAILQLVDKPSLVSGGERMIYGSKIDTDGALEYFEGKFGGGSGGSDALGDTPVGYIQVYPTDVFKFRLETLRYYCNPTGGVTYNLYLFEQASAGDVQNLADIVFDSDAAQVDSESYIAVSGNKLPIDVKLTDAGKLYYIIDWTGDPGTTPGYIEMRGRKLV